MPSNDDGELIRELELLDDIDATEAGLCERCRYRRSSDDGDDDGEGWASGYY